MHHSMFRIPERSPRGIVTVFFLFLTAAPQGLDAQQLRPVLSVEAAPALGPRNGATATSAQARADTAVQAGYGTITINGLLQNWYVTGSREFRRSQSNSFRIRRAELKLSGDIRPKAHWTVMMDVAKILSVSTTSRTVASDTVVGTVATNQASRILQDAFLTLDYIPHVRIDVGQRKVPLSLEGLQSSAALKTVERALMFSDRARGGDFGDVRDIGLLAYGPITRHIDYQLGIYNGLGENQNALDRNDEKAVAGRLVFRPAFLPGLQVGGSGGVSGGDAPGTLYDNRVAGELLYERGNITVQSEIMNGADAGISRLGYYFLAAYRVTPRIEPVLRIDVFDPDTDRGSTAASVTERDYLVGANYLIDGNHLKLQANYLAKTFSSITETQHVLQINLQAAW